MNMNSSALFAITLLSAVFVFGLCGLLHSGNASCPPFAFLKDSRGSGNMLSAEALFFATALFLYGRLNPKKEIKIPKEQYSSLFLTFARSPFFLSKLHIFLLLALRRGIVHSQVYH